MTFMNEIIVWGESSSSVRKPTQGKERTETKSLVSMTPPAQWGMRVKIERGRWDEITEWFVSEACLSPLLVVLSLTKHWNWVNSFELKTL